MEQLNFLKNIPGLLHSFSEIKDGNMSFVWGEREKVLENRNKFFRNAGVEPENSVVMFLKHGTDIAVVGQASRGNEAPEVDCLITKSKNVFLSVLTADCLPIILFDKINGVLALAHLSRINTPKNFARAIVETMESQGAAAENILVGIGPHIRKESYVFDAEELRKRVPDEKIFKGFIVDLPDSSFRQRGNQASARFGEAGEVGKKAIDLTGYNVSELTATGVLKENIEVSDIDTGKDRNFFSHYRSRLTGEPEGRMLTVVGMD